MLELLNSLHMHMLFTMPRGPCSRSIHIKWGMSWINWDIWSTLAKTQIAFQPTDHSFWDASCVVFPKPVVDTQMITSARLSYGYLSCFPHWLRKSLKMRDRFFYSYLYKMLLQCRSGRRRMFNPWVEKISVVFLLTTQLSCW